MVGGSQEWLLGHQWQGKNIWAKTYLRLMMLYFMSPGIFLQNVSPFRAVGELLYFSSNLHSGSIQL